MLAPVESLTNGNGVERLRGQGGRRKLAYAANAMANAVTPS
jgi:hypothetical protein